MEITSLLFDLNYKFELTGASLLALAKSIYYILMNIQGSVVLEKEKKKQILIIMVIIIIMKLDLMVACVGGACQRDSQIVLQVNG